MVSRSASRMPPKPKQASVGRALMKRHQQQKAAKGELGAKALQEKTKLVSVLDSTSLDDFLSTALMAQRDFTATKERDLILLDTKGASTTLSMSRQRKIQAKIESLKVNGRLCDAAHTVFQYPLPCARNLEILLYIM